MGAHILAAICLLSTLITLAQSQLNATCYEKFLENNTRGFPGWIHSNNLDPSPVLSEPTHILVWNKDINLDWHIRTHGVRGHSTNITIRNVSTDILTLEFSVDMTMTENVTFFGEYTANGTVGDPRQNQTEISGEGNWEISVPAIFLNPFQIIMFISIIANTVGIRSHSLPITLEEENGFHLAFENLFDNGFPEEQREFVEKSVLNAYASYASEDRGVNPLKALYLRYWEDILEELTVTELLTCATPTPSTTQSTFQK